MCHPEHLLSFFPIKEGKKEKWIRKKRGKEKNSRNSQKKLYSDNVYLAKSGCFNEENVMNILPNISNVQLMTYS